MIKKSRAVRLLMALALLASAMIGVQGTMTAEARCLGPGRSTTSTLTVGGSVWMIESPIGSTCNNNGSYSTKFRARSNMVGFLLKENGGTWTSYGHSVDGAWVTAAWSSPTRKSNLSFCVAGILNGQIGTMTCGYGTHYSTETIRNGQDVQPVMIRLAKRNHFLSTGF